MITKKLIVQLFTRIFKLEEVPEVYQNFGETFVRGLDIHGPRKTKALRDNHKLHVDRNLRKVIMKHSALKRKASKTKHQGDITRYEKQRNLVVKLNGETKLHYVNDLKTSKNLKPY